MISMAVMVKAPLPVFCNPMLWGELMVPVAWFPKAKLAVERLAEELAVPIPDRFTDWGLLGALSFSVTVAAKEPTALGAN